VGWSRGCGAALNRPEGPPRRAGQGNQAARATAAGQTRPRVRPRHARSGMTDGPQRSTSAVQARAGETGWRLAGPAGGPLVDWRR
jgi:hypothetical protein